MTKRGSKKNNIIPIPNLKGRLLEKGMEELHDKNYRQAIELLEQTIFLDSENSEAYIGLILANFESGYYKKAKELAEEMLKYGIGDYIQAVDLYLMILVQLKEYDSIETTLEGLLEDKQVPKEKYEHFSRLLHFSRKMNEEQSKLVSNDDVLNQADEEKLDLFAYDEPKQQMLIAARLAKENIRPYIQEVKKYLGSSEGHPFQKSMLLNILREQEYDQEVRVTKLSMSENFIPSVLPSIEEMIKFQDVLTLLEQVLESEDPVLCENIKSLVKRNLFLLYPFNPRPDDPKAWAAAYHYVVNQYFGHEESMEDYLLRYEALESDLLEAMAFIKKLEEISYPIV